MRDQKRSNRGRGRAMSVLCFFMAAGLAGVTALPALAGDLLVEESTVGVEDDFTEEVIPEVYEDYVENEEIFFNEEEVPVAVPSADGDDVYYEVYYNSGNGNAEAVQEQPVDYSNVDILGGDAADPGAAALEDGLIFDESALEPSVDSLTDSFMGLPLAMQERLRLKMAQLTQAPSPAGSDGELLIGDYIINTMKDLGYVVNTQEFHEGFLNADLVDVPAINIMAERIAEGDAVTDDVLLVVGHYDSKAKPRDGDPLANDKTGAAVLLETAELLSELDSSTLDVCFVFLSGEEDGFFGSEDFAEYISAYRDRLIGVICVGPVGYVLKEETAEDETEEPGEAGTEAETEEPAEAGIEAETEEAGEAEAGAAGEDAGNWEIRQLPYVIRTSDGNENSLARLMQSCVSMEAARRAILDAYSSDHETTLNEAGNAAMNSAGVVPPAQWTCEKAGEGSATAFEVLGAPVITVCQDLGEETEIEPDERALTRMADILTGDISLYMSGMR